MHAARGVLFTLLTVAACNHEPVGVGSEVPRQPPSPLSPATVREIGRLAGEQGLSGLIGVQLEGDMVARPTNLFHPGRARGTGTTDRLAFVASGPGVDTAEPEFIVRPGLLKLPEETFTLDQGWGCFVGPDFFPASVEISGWTHESIWNTGGHGTVHTLVRPKPKGSWSSTGGVFPDGHFVSVFVPDEAAGDERIRYRVTALEGPCVGGFVDVDITYAIRLSGLVLLANGQDGLILDLGFESDHTSIFYVTPGVGSWTYQLQRDYLAATGRNLTVTAASLPFGGLHDIQGDWFARHNRHRCGFEVDFQGVPPGTTKKKAFKEDLDLIAELGMKPGRFPSCIVERDHVHCATYDYRQTSRKGPRCPGL